jgi:hypothetical protein
MTNRLAVAVDAAAASECRAQACERDAAARSQEDESIMRGTAAVHVCAALGVSDDRPVFRCAQLHGGSDARSHVQVGRVAAAARAAASGPARMRNCRVQRCSSRGARAAPVVRACSQRCQRYGDRSLSFTIRRRRTAGHAAGSSCWARSLIVALQCSDSFPRRSYLLLQRPVRTGLHRRLNSKSACASACGP